jgi:UDP-N-acetylmuramoyl-L-alanyl-D-glutamate--2,6-diaminopimelate ligase
VAIFTNFAQDHLDFYGTMENYLMAKATIFEYLKDGAHLFLNTDDQVSEQLMYKALACNLSAVQIHGIGMHDAIHTTDRFSAISENLDQLVVTTREATYTTKGVVGIFSAYNVMMAVSAARVLGISVAGVQQVLQNFPGVPGRLYTIALSDNRFAVVDYAHNALSTQSVLQLLRPLTQQLIVIFGCGGNRDATRRPLMGALVAQYADLAIVTSDNPRFEDPQKIIQEIIAGMVLRPGLQHVIEPDRAAAIAQGLAKLERGGILAILGKGHERNQIIAGVCYPFDDAEMVCRLSSLA